MANQQQLNLNVNINDLPLKTCECGHIFVVPRLQLRFLSKLMSPNGQAQYIMLQSGFLCAFCGKEVDMTIPEEKSNIIIPDFNKTEKESDKNLTELNGDKNES